MYLSFVVQLCSICEELLGFDLLAFVRRLLSGEKQQKLNEHSNERETKRYTNGVSFSLLVSLETTKRMARREREREKHVRQ